MGELLGIPGTTTEGSIMPGAERTIKTTYYGPSPGRGKAKPVVKITRGSRIGECLPNASRMLTTRLNGDAVVAEVTDELFGQLLLVATYFPGEKFNVIFEQDVNRPVCIITDLTHEDIHG
jgi:hypothetical protein